LISIDGAENGAVFAFPIGDIRPDFGAAAGGPAVEFPCERIGGKGAAVAGGGGAPKADGITFFHGAALPGPKGRDLRRARWNLDAHGIGRGGVESVGDEDLNEDDAGEDDADGKKEKGVKRKKGSVMAY